MSGENGSGSGDGELPFGLDGALDAGALIRRTDLGRLGFETSDELDDGVGTVGQERAERALAFGVGIRDDGFHIFALGPENAHKREIVRDLLCDRAEGEPAPDDLCYVNDFERWHRPRALRLPPGRGRELSADMDLVLEGLGAGLRAAFESEEYQARRQALTEAATEEHKQSLEALQESSRSRGLALLRTPGGFAFAPMKDGEVVPPDELGELTDEERGDFEEKVEELQKELQQILRRVPRQQRELQREVRQLNRDVAGVTARDHLEPLRETYGDLPQVREFLDQVQDDVVEHVQAIVQADGDSGGRGNGQGEGRGGAPRPRRPVGPGGGASTALDRPELRRYRVNVIVDHGDSKHAPVIYEDHPTYQNLVGRLEYLAVMGALITDFNLIKAGALHRANGGYLILDVHRVLMQPLAWESLKRVLQAGELRLESPHQAMGMVTTMSLEPEPVALDVKVVLMGSPTVYYLLSELDPDFPRLFKVAADFDDRMPRTPDDEAIYARLLAGMVRREGLRPFRRSALERIMEWGARRLGDAERLSVQVDEILDVMREANHWCGDEGADTVTEAHVRRAEDESVHRSSRIRDRLRDEILRDTLLIDTEGEATGQVNGLSVLRMGGFSFGRPTRITARARMGRGEVTDIEREVELSGPIHSKGVLILSAFLGARYAWDRPLSLSASLVFEQSYSGVDGDSASAAELCALLSAIGRIPLRQSVAVTGAVNQHGQVQAIGGANEKIEGFFEVCAARGLTGRQGVVIPEANRKHLMLRDDVVQAVDEGRFHVWTVDHVDRLMEVLSGVPMGEADEEGRYPDESVNGRVGRRLADFAARYKAFTAPGGEDPGQGIANGEEG